MTFAKPISVAAAKAVEHETVTPAYYATNLTRGHATANILLNDKVYTLRITKAGKLILTK